ncbi:MAG: hypothetical protein KatS3mg025_0306 [Bacteroidia bacterium]|nr:MAG: hypothetical protein KatS3mg025_0306 [Bacteroidia bacterium]
MEAYPLARLLEADRAWRINFINSLIGPKNLHVLITRTSENLWNAAIFNSGLHVGSSPPYVGFLLRPTTVPRHTYANLKKYPYATLNAVSRDFYKQAHKTHKKFPAEESEVTALGLSLRWAEGEDMPYVADSPLTARLRWVEGHLISVNQTHLLVFGVEKVWTTQPPAEDGYLPLHALGLVAGSGCDAYYELGFLGREPIERS